MKDNQNKSFWERFARLYPVFMKKEADLYSQICDRVSEKISAPEKVLEIACGTGQLSVDLSKHSGSYIATDFSEAMISVAKAGEVPSNLSYMVEDATELSFPDESFDAVIISNALHIMPDPEKALKEIKRVLKKDGKLFAPTFTTGSGFLFAVRSSVLSAAGFKIYHKWYKDDYKKFIEDNGFTVVKCETFGSSTFPLCYIEADK